MTGRCDRSIIVIRAVAGGEFMSVDEEFNKSAFPDAYEAWLSMACIEYKSKGLDMGIVK